MCPIGTRHEQAGGAMARRRPDPPVPQGFCRLGSEAAPAVCSCPTPKDPVQRNPLAVGRSQLWPGARGGARAGHNCRRNPSTRVRRVRPRIVPGAAARRTAQLPGSGRGGRSIGAGGASPLGSVDPLRVAGFPNRFRTCGSRLADGRGNQTAGQGIAGRSAGTHTGPVPRDPVLCRDRGQRCGQPFRHHAAAQAVCP